MNGSATLEKRDRYLCSIWLECCGHLSHFAFGGWDGDKLGMKQKISDVFDSDDPLTRLYDYGTTSETMIYMSDTRKGKPTTRHPIALVNSPRLGMCGYSGSAQPPY